MMPATRSRSEPSVLPLFASAELTRLEAERERLIRALARMRERHQHGAILRTEFRLRQITSRWLALSCGKELGE